MRITMLQSRRLKDGSIREAGETRHVPDAEGRRWVKAGYAVETPEDMAPAAEPEAEAIPTDDQPLDIASAGIRRRPKR